MPTASDAKLFFSSGVEEHNYAPDSRQAEMEPCTRISVLLISVHEAWAGPLIWTTKRQETVLQHRGNQRHWKKIFAHDGKYNKFKTVTHDGSQWHCKAGGETRQQDTTMLEWSTDKSWW